MCWQIKRTLRPWLFEKVYTYFLKKTKVTMLLAMELFNYYLIPNIFRAVPTRWMHK